jgi:hypothetical protein
MPATPFEGETGEGNELFDPTAAGGANRQRRIGKLLAGLEDAPAIVTFIFVDRHGLTPPVEIAAVI